MGRGLAFNKVDIAGVAIACGTSSHFSTRNDKHNVIIATAGPVRVALELLLYFVAAVAPGLNGLRWCQVWPQGTVVASIYAGLPGFSWLIRDAPTPD